MPAYFLFLLWVAIGVFGRLIIHVPDATPLTSLCLLAPIVFSKRFSFLIILITLFLSDFILHFLFHYAVFGSWTLFTYSGWLMVAVIGFLFSKKSTILNAILYSAFSAVIFWVWTDFGTWITTALYAHTAQGLLNCYIAALPFLRNSMLGAMAWSVVLVYLLFRHNIIHRHIPTFWNNIVYFLKFIRRAN
ncbi:MAG: hypothetical protein ACD_42C00407G0003 [uncultured bacterium]|nr:MAG: hypothetical protein ACD_42C00407G0003 [uncultured bacterium]